MTTDSRLAGGHAPDGALVILLDGADASADPLVREHVERCAACTERLAVLERRASAVSRMLHAVDVEPDANAMRSRLHHHVAARRRRAPFWTRPAARAAAAIVVVAGIAAATPIGDIVTRATRVVWRAAAPAADVPPPPTAEAALPSASGTLIRFAPPTGSLLVRFTDRPAAGALTVLPGGEGSVSARITGHAGDEEFVIRPHQLEVRNSAGSSAEYQVVIPQGMSVVVVVDADTLFLGRLDAPLPPISLPRSIPRTAPSEGGAR